MNNDEIRKILEEHEIWVKSGGVRGKRADLARADLTGANLRGADLRWADLRWANLAGANLTEANLRWADLRKTNLTEANLAGANLRWADLNKADLYRANLAGANLTGANLTGANLTRADLNKADLNKADLYRANLAMANLTRTDLAGADLREANLRGADLSRTLGVLLACPETGAFEAYKKCANNIIVKLLIPEDAKRSSSTGRKCRADKAKVLEIYGAEEAKSAHDSSLIYRVGETLEVPDFDENRWHECAPGIHFFITRKEAEEY